MARTVPAIVGGLAGLTVAATAVALIIVLRKRKRNQIKTIKAPEMRSTKENNLKGTINVSKSASKGIKSSRSGEKGGRQRGLYSNQVERVDAGSALPSYLSGVDTSMAAENVEAGKYGLNSATPSTDDEESAEETGKQVKWRDGQKHTKGGQKEKEPPDLVQQLTWESLTSWIPK